MKPTIGRIVHFQAPGTEGGGVYAAIVTAVHSDTCVDLWTFGPGSLYFHSSVTEGTPDDVGRGRWYWPPRV